MKGHSPLHPNNCFWRQTDEEGCPHSDSWLVISDKQGMLRVELCCSDEYPTLHSASLFTYTAYIQKKNGFWISEILWTLVDFTYCIIMVDMLIFIRLEEHFSSTPRQISKASIFYAQSPFAIISYFPLFPRQH